MKISFNARLFTLLTILTLSLACNFGQAAAPTPLPPTVTFLPPTETPVPPTATAIPPTETATPEPPTPLPAVVIRLGPGKFGHPLWLEVLEGSYQINSGATLLTGSAIGVAEDWLTFPAGLVIEVAEGGVTLKDKKYPAGTKLTVDASGNLTESAVSSNKATSSSEILYQDDFSSNARGWLTGSSSDTYGELSREIKDGQYVMTLKGAQDYFVAVTTLPDFSGQDFVFNLDLTILEGTFTADNFWIDFSLREAEGVNGKHYSFTFYSDGTSSCDLWPTAKWQDAVSLLGRKANRAIQLKPGQTSTIQIEANGSNFTLSVNGQEVGTTTNDVINSTGGLSFLMGLNKAGETISVAFDNLVIRNIP